MITQLKSNWGNKATAIYIRSFRFWYHQSEVPISYWLAVNIKIYCWQIMAPWSKHWYKLGRYRLNVIKNESNTIQKISFESWYFYVSLKQGFPKKNRKQTLLKIQNETWTIQCRIFKKLTMYRIQASRMQFMWRISQKNLEMNQCQSNKIFYGFKPKYRSESDQKLF